MKLRNYFTTQKKLDTYGARWKLSFTLIALFFAGNLMAQTPELVSSDAIDPRNLTESNGKLFFGAEATDGKIWLWSTDGTTTEIRGASGLPNSHPGSQPKELMVFNDQLFLSSVYKEGANWNREFFTYIGITDKLKLLKNIRNGGASDPTGFTELDGNLYFSADDGNNGEELWITDGTGNGTELHKNIAPGSKDGSPGGFFEFNGMLYFSASNGLNNNGRELWVTDGTTPGTEMLKDINPGSSSYPAGFTEYNEEFYFSAYHETKGKELWVSDGTEGGTVLLKDINQGSDDSTPSYFTEYDGKLYFDAKDGTHGQELWVTDGTPSGTQILKDINQGAAHGYPHEFAEYDGELYFVAGDGSNGRELWVTDGTAQGTQMFMDINSGADDAFPSNSAANFTEYNGRLYFSADDGSNGVQLWETDGNPAGTTIIEPDAASNADPVNGSQLEIVVSDGSLYYTADYDGNGVVLWKLTTDLLSVEEHTKNKLVIYPNPVQDILHLETTTNTVEKIELFSITGQQLKTWKGKTDINLSQFAPGSYFVKITTADDQTVVKQIIKN